MISNLFQVGEGNIILTGVTVLYGLVFACSYPDLLCQVSLTVLRFGNISLLHVGTTLNFLVH